MSSKLTWIPVSLLAAGGLAGGWFLKTSLNKEKAPQASNSAEEASSRLSSDRRDSKLGTNIKRSRSGSSSPITSSENLGDYQIDSEGRRIYVGPRDITVLNRLSSLHPHDTIGQVEVAGQLSQMSPEELAEAWKEFSKNDPLFGSSSQLVATQVFTRLRAAGIEFEVPPNWANVEKSIATAIEIDDARRNAEEYRERLVAGEDLGIHQRRAMFRALAAKDPAAAAQLWAEHSTPEQQVAEAKSLAIFMLDPAAREPLLKLISETADSDMRGSLITDLGSEWAAQDSEAFEKWLDSTGDPQLKSQASFLILNMRSRIDPVTSVDFAQTMEKEYRGDAIKQSVQALADHDWVQGAEVISKMTDPENRQAAIAGYGFVMAAKRYDDFLSWRDTLSPAEQDVANEKAFVPFATHDPAAALSWLEKRPEGPEKDALRVNLLFTGNYQNITDQIELIKTIKTPKERRRAIGLTLQNIELTNLEEIQRILDEVSTGSNQ